MEEKQLDEKYPALEYEKKVFSLTPEEKGNLLPFEDITKFVNTLNMLAQIAQVAKNNFIAENVFKRLNVKKSFDSEFTYDVTKGTVIVYEPRTWCSVCGVKKATHKIGEKVCCLPCAEKIKEGMAKKIEEKEEKKPKVANAKK